MSWMIISILLKKVAENIKAGGIPPPLLNADVGFNLHFFSDAEVGDEYPYTTLFTFFYHKRYKRQ